MWISSPYLFYGVVLSLPFAIANALVVLKSELFLSLLRPFGTTTGYEQVLVLTLITLVGVGGLVTLVPLLREKKLYVVNAIIGVGFIIFALFAGYGLGVDVYHCDILKIPNCD